MQISNSYNTNTDAVKMAVSAPGDSGISAASKSYPSPPGSVALNDVPGNPFITVDNTFVTRYEGNEQLQQFVEWMRVAGESRRLEYLHELLMKEGRETSDLFGKIMDIAQRIMRSEEVSLDEMRFLAEQSPQLLYVVIMLKYQISDFDGRERRYDRERRQGDRRAKARRRKENLRSRLQSQARENKYYTVLIDLDKDISSIKVKDSINKFTDNNNG